MSKAVNNARRAINGLEQKNVPGTTEKNNLEMFRKNNWFLFSSEREREKK